jgi:hypothetical protein
MLRRSLLVCGILAAVLWMGGDILASLRYLGYSFTDQAVSELSAIGAPTRPFLMPVLNVFSLLEIVFAVGVWEATGSKRGLRITAGLLLAHGAIGVVLGVINLVTPIGAMHVREELSQTGGTLLNDTLHLVLTGVTVVLVLLMIGFGANAFGKRWRLYSYATIAALVASAVWTSLDAGRVAANLPTPWMGLRERVNVYGFMLWMLALAVALLRAPMSATAAKPSTGIGAPRLTPR